MVIEWGLLDLQSPSQLQIGNSNIRATPPL